MSRHIRKNVCSKGAQDNMPLLARPLMLLLLATFMSTRQLREAWLLAHHTGQRVYHSTPPMLPLLATFTSTHQRRGAWLLARHSGRVYHSTPPTLLLLATFIHPLTSGGGHSFLCGRRLRDGGQASLRCVCGQHGKHRARCARAAARTCCTQGNAGPV